MESFTANCVREKRSAQEEKIEDLGHGRSSAVAKHGSGGVVEWWSGGVVEYCSIGVLE